MTTDQKYKIKILDEFLKTIRHLSVASIEMKMEMHSPTDEIKYWCNTLEKEFNEFNKKLAKGNKNDRRKLQRKSNKHIPREKLRRVSANCD